MSTASTTPTLALDFLQARPVVPRPWRELEILLVGCGGTGSWLAPHIARLVWLLRQDGKSAVCTFIDPDRVEAANLVRQQFCPAEVGAPKAAALALRYGRAWGLDIPAHVAPFHPDMIGRVGHEVLRVVVGCVDNAAARQLMADRVHDSNRHTGRGDSPPGLWWLDCGNSRDAGQVLVGTASVAAELLLAFTPATICRALPSPALQRPELLEALPEEAPDASLSCAELALVNAQALMINQSIATAAADMLFRLLLIGDLRRFATYVDGPSGVQKSLYTTPEAVGAVIGQKAAFFVPAKKSKG